MLARLVGRLECDGIENTVVSLARGGALADATAANGTRVIALGMKPGRPSLPALFRLVRLLKAIDPHVLQTWLYHADLMGLVAGALARVPDYDPQAVAATAERYSLERWQAGMAEIWEELAPVSDR